MSMKDQIACSIGPFTAARGRFLLILTFLLASPMSIGGRTDAPIGARKTLREAASYFRSISTNGGYVGIYSLDLKDRFGESFYEKATAGQIWVQPPGTPSVGRAYLEAYRVTGADYYLEAARETARALVWGQRKVGGWDHRVDVSHMQQDQTMPHRKAGRCTMDDNITQGALSFLMEIDTEIDEPWLTDGVRLGCEYMMESQFENGAWPQWYPLIGGYHDYYTFNDNTINDCIQVMLKAHRVYGNEEYLRTAEAGGQFIIDSQLDPPQAGWAQQYSHKMEPAWARGFEPPGVCSAATARNIRTLIDLYLYTRNQDYLSPIPDAIDWLQRSHLESGKWARLYEVGTNRPVYGDRQDPGKKHYEYDEISSRERNSYAWQAGFGIPNAIDLYKKVKRLGAEEYRPRRQKPLSEEQMERRAEKLRPRVERIVNNLDDKGRWVSQTENGKRKVIYSKVFVRNLRTLCDYLKMTGGAEQGI